MITLNDAQFFVYKFVVVATTENSSFLAIKTSDGFVISDVRTCPGDAG